MTAPVPAGLDPADERGHTPGDDAGWAEAWYFDFATRDAALGGYVRIDLRPHEGICWYWACVVGRGRRLVTVIDHDVPAPRRRTLMIRHDGLWADHTVEVPFDHMTLGCEAFALALDDPAEAYGPMRGERVPLGFDLDWDTDGAGSARRSGGGYEVPCLVHGEVLVGDERIELDAVGHRTHVWGDRGPWGPGWTWVAGRLDDGTRLHAAVGADADAASAHVQPPAASPQAVSPVVTTGPPDGRDLPAAARVRLGDLVLDVEPVAFAPVLLAGRAGRPARLPRAMCRIRAAATDRSGVGWMEWQVAPPDGA